MLLGSAQSKGRGRASLGHKTTTIRQFDGGWNVIDNELTLTPRYARLFDNMVRAADGSVAVRYGYQLWGDFKKGTETQVNDISLNYTIVNGSRRVKLNWVAHGLTTGHHVTFTGIPSFGGIPVSEINTTHSVRVINANEFEIVTTTPANTSAGPTAFVGTINALKDTHTVGGSIVNGIYFQDRLVVVTSIGEVIGIDAVGAATVHWNNAIAFALTGTPASWAGTDFVSFNVFGGKLHIHNGVDKPLEFDINASSVVIFLGDPASAGSNAFVPIGKYGLSSSAGYMAIAGIEDDPALLQFSANLSAGVWTGNASPDDATDVDMSKVSGTFEPAIVGLAELRDKLLVAFKDTISIGTLGAKKTVGTAQIHDPSFKDTIAQHGTISHRTIVSLGNDIFMCDRVGVPSISQSSISEQIVPDRVSDLVEPEIQKNVNRLTDITLQNNTFAIFNPHERQYMLFMPKFDSADSTKLTTDPITFLADLDNDQFMLYMPGHNLEEDDSITLTGITDIESNLAATINGSWTVATIIDEDYFTVKTGSAFLSTDVSGGGTLGNVKRTTQETIGYIFSYNPKLKIKAWSRYRGMNFDWAARSAFGFIFAGKAGKIYMLGNKQLPIYADKAGDYDYRTWANSKDYIVGDRVYDSSVNTVFSCLIAHTSPVGGTFIMDREDNVDRWEEYVGDPIKFTWEWPWGDFDKRLKTKQIIAMYPDTGGSGSFDLHLFVDELYKNSAGERTPVRTITFTGGEAPGYGGGDQPYGGGRRTKEQLIWPVPVHLKLYKVRIEGETTDPLRIIAVSIIYKEGNVKR